jgi:hypothetical protein
VAGLIAAPFEVEVSVAPTCRSSLDTGGPDDRLGVGTSIHSSGERMQKIGQPVDIRQAQRIRARLAIRLLETDEFAL